MEQGFALSQLSGNKNWMIEWLPLHPSPNQSSYWSGFGETCCKVWELHRLVLEIYLSTLSYFKRSRTRSLTNLIWSPDEIETVVSCSHISGLSIFKPIFPAAWVGPTLTLTYNLARSKKQLLISQHRRKCLVMNPPQTVLTKIRNILHCHFRYRKRERRII